MTVLVKRYLVKLIISSAGDWLQADGDQIINMIGGRCLSNDDIEFAGIEEVAAATKATSSDDA